MKTHSATLEDAIAIALEAHRDVKQRNGEPYILHPLTLMLRVQGLHAQMVAVLHDVVEDSPLTLDDLRARGIPPEVVAAVDALTRREGESYEQFIQRILPNRLACVVKLADIEHNMDVRRLPSLTDKDAARLARYHAAWALLSQSVD